MVIIILNRIILGKLKNVVYRYHDAVFGGIIKSAGAFDRFLQ